LKFETLYLEARVDVVGILLKQSVSIVHDLIVLLSLQDSHNSGHVSGRGFGVHDHGQSSQPDIVRVLLVSKDRHEIVDSSIEHGIPASSPDSIGPHLSSLSSHLSIDQVLELVSLASKAKIHQSRQGNVLVFPVISVLKVVPELADMFGSQSGPTFALLRTASITSPHTGDLDQMSKAQWDSHLGEPVTSLPVQESLKLFDKLGVGPIEKMV
jgi:hypothetical protein